MKTISVPTSPLAAERLDLGQEQETDTLDMLLSEQEFNVLFSSGFIEQVNKLANVNIDDYEDEVISDPRGLKVCENLSVEFFNRTQLEVFSKIIAQAEFAQKAGTSLHFFF
ncbi:hypothetical protein [uncultured Litoreibacter sp.]|uniref:hypothetical protein n=1 Tax=uncultured Litoreibacter sp. TaxID=1392394 RepID=UPI002621B533|nr:hypothetical protein [uncultured Litoreibacter sp.]